ncbi:MAG: hypothetical protein UV34_C0006G0004 [Parcubacteria group bacterium GW2011_GWB1_42_6]|nr:MAG: hypothetical protein UV34_C0006G0004 [Parcubacteria group bacterium GW2011_GWB1_42_6]
MAMIDVIGLISTPIKTIITLNCETPDLSFPPQAGIQKITQAGIQKIKIKSGFRLCLLAGRNDNKRVS